ncbi:KRAB [Lepeophtheirus salmonis]|uniref:KRAB n=1 Tax=Lepeophtheirus salmonis TaxID=72036 RepID=A0A7R8H7B8_LEPSM|nr:KRAB [Lepeophtheirus salmonis]CAF2920400.1 KRAB [Lepeophtheirus salmonis]
MQLNEEICLFACISLPKDTSFIEMKPFLRILYCKICYFDYLVSEFLVILPGLVRALSIDIVITSGFIPHLGCLICPFECGKLFKSQFTLNGDLRNHHQPSFFMCEECGAEKEYSGSLKLHLAMMNKEQQCKEYSRLKKEQKADCQASLSKLTKDFQLGLYLGCYQGTSKTKDFGFRTMTQALQECVQEHHCVEKSHKTSCEPNSIMSITLRKMGRALKWPHLYRVPHHRFFSSFQANKSSLSGPTTSLILDDGSAKS